MATTNKTIELRKKTQSEAIEKIFDKEQIYLTQEDFGFDVIVQKINRAQSAALLKFCNKNSFSFTIKNDFKGIKIMIYNY